MHTGAAAIGTADGVTAPSEMVWRVTGTPCAGADVVVLDALDERPIADSAIPDVDASAGAATAAAAGC